jgi:hypothetical protein
LRQPNSCCGLISWRRAISDTFTPGARLSATIAILRASGQSRRRSGPEITSIRRGLSRQSRETVTHQVTRWKVGAAQRLRSSGRQA